MSFSVQYGYGVRNVDEAIATLRANRKPRPAEFISAHGGAATAVTAATLKIRGETLQVHSSQAAAELLSTTQPVPEPPVSKSHRNTLPRLSSASSSSSSATSSTSSSPTSLFEQAGLKTLLLTNEGRSVGASHSRRRKGRQGRDYDDDMHSASHSRRGMKTNFGKTETGEYGENELDMRDESNDDAYEYDAKQRRQTAMLKQQEEEVQAEIQAFQERLRKREALKGKREEDSFRQTLAEFNEEGRKFVSQIERFLDVREEAVSRRCEATYHDWHRKVFDNIHRGIQNRNNNKKIHRMNKTTAAVNGSTVSESITNNIKDKNKTRLIGDLNDPTFAELDSMRKERQLFFNLHANGTAATMSLNSMNSATQPQNVNGNTVQVPFAGLIDPDAAQPRDVLDPREWAMHLIRDGHHGRYFEQQVADSSKQQWRHEDGIPFAGAGPRPRAFITGEPGSRQIPKLSRSHVVFDHFTPINDKSGDGRSNVGGKYFSTRLKSESYESTQRVVNHDLAYKHVGHTTVKTLQGESGSTINEPVVQST